MDIRAGDGAVKEAALEQSEPFSWQGMYMRAADRVTINGERCRLPLVIGYGHVPPPMLTVAVPSFLIPLLHRGSQLENCLPVVFSHPFVYLFSNP